MSNAIKVLGLAFASMGLLGGCAATNTDDYNTCAMGWSALGLGVGLASSGTGVVIAGAAGGAGLGVLLCDEELPMPEAPEIEPANIPVAEKPEPVGDEDGDGVKDDRDACPGTRPGVEVDYRGCAKPLVFDATALHFEFDSAELPADVDTVLSGALEYIERYEDSRFMISGHTDSMGSDAYNEELSFCRAKAIRDWLLGRGVESSRLEVTGLGETQPVSSNETDTGRARNRRVEIQLLN